MSKKKNKKKTNEYNTEIWTEEQHEQYMKGVYSMDFIAGYTEGGIPYGISLDEDNERLQLFGENPSYDNDGEELPFKLITIKSNEASYLL